MDGTWRCNMPREAGTGQTTLAKVGLIVRRWPEHRSVPAGHSQAVGFTRSMASLGQDSAISSP